MRKTAGVALVLLLLLSTASCASPPVWSGTETGAGEFVWAPSPGWRFYVNVVLLGGLFLLFASALVQDIRKRKRGEAGSIGCSPFLVFFLGLALFFNIRDFVWHDSFTIGRNGINHSHYTPFLIFQTKKTTAVDWPGVRHVAYSSDMSLEYREPNTITDPLSGKRYRRIGSSSSGARGRAISFCRDAYVCAPAEGGEDILLILEKENFGRFEPVDWILGSDEYRTSPREEARLKAAIRRFMPATLEEAMSSETRAYFALAAKPG